MPTNDSMPTGGCSTEAGPTRFVGYLAAPPRPPGSWRCLLAEPATEGGDGGATTSPHPGGAHVEIFLQQTPFYAEGGGQLGDTGTIETDSGRATVIDTNSALPGLTRHLAVMDAGEIHPGQTATASIDEERRVAIRRNHTGTHLLHWALRQVLGDHVKQHGSQVGPDRLRFDFTHYGPLSMEEAARVEDLVNGQVLADEDVTVAVMAKTDADQAGAIAFFEDKYGDEVRVVRAGSQSLELCGGTHVARRGQIGPIENVSEGSIGSNLRRIFATTGTTTLARLRQAERQIG